MFTSRRSDSRSGRQGRTSNQFPRLARYDETDEPARVLNDIENVSRRIDSLARELNCFGYFDDDSDRPRAA